MQRNSDIDAIIDDRFRLYAYVWLEQSHGYGHMNMTIRLPAANEWDWRPECVIKVSSQIGGTECGKPYAVKWGLDTCYSNNPIDVTDVEMAAKLMKRIQKKLDAMNESIGFTEDVAELCQRVLIASGCKNLIAEESYWADGSHMHFKKLLKAGSAESMMYLIKAEKSLIDRFRAFAA